MICGTNWTPRSPSETSSGSWVKGHAGHPLNEKADRIANAEARGRNPYE